KSPSSSSGTHVVRSDGSPLHLGGGEGTGGGFQRGRLDLCGILLVACGWRSSSSVGDDDAVLGEVQGSNDSEDDWPVRGVGRRACCRGGRNHPEKGGASSDHATLVREEDEPEETLKL